LFFKLILIFSLYNLLNFISFSPQSFKSLFTPDFDAFVPLKEADKQTVAISRAGITEI
jgi:hypothetical protein